MKSMLTILLLLPNCLFAFGAGQDDLKEGKALLVAGEYEKAFPLLAKTTDKLLAPLAEVELSKPADFMAVAAQYKDAVKKAPGPLKLALADRMVYWYGKQWAVTTDEKQKAELRKIFTSIEPIPPGADKPGNPSPLLVGWNEFPGKFGVFLDQQVVRSGRQSVKTVPVNPVSAHSAFGTPMIPATAGKTYVFSAWVLSTADVDALLDLRFFDGDGKQLKGGRVAVPQDSPFWKKVGQEVTAPEGTFRMDLVLAVQGLRTGVVWMDDASIKMGGAEVLKNGGFEGK